MTGRAELSVVEGTIDITDPDAVLVYISLPDAPTGEDPNPQGLRNEYVYEDPDHLDSIARWTWRETTRAPSTKAEGSSRAISSSPTARLRKSTDANKDNVYEVTLVATDTNPLGDDVAGIGKVKVWLIVTNVEEAGMVVFTEGETAFLNEMLVAEVQDPDDHGGTLGEPHQGVHIVNWQWSRAETDVADTEFEDIVGVTTNTYTPRNMDRASTCRATARYTDPLRTEDLPGTIGGRTHRRGLAENRDGDTEKAVRAAPGLGSAPTFDEMDPVTREVAENTAPGGNVGDPVEAMAANTDETLVYPWRGPTQSTSTLATWARLR